MENIFIKNDLLEKILRLKVFYPQKREPKGQNWVKHKKLYHIFPLFNNLQFYSLFSKRSKENLLDNCYDNNV
jgi:hypothetical protein